MTEKRIAIHGLGYVGLTAALHWARAGWTVVGYDPDFTTVDGLNRGEPRAGEFLSYLNDDIAMFVKHGRLRATMTFEETLSCPVHSIAVPTEKDGKPYDAIVEAVLGRLLTPALSDITILVESTLTPGTIDRVMARYDGLWENRALAVCPRRDWFAGKDSHLGVMKRIVGGYTAQCTARAVELLSAVSSDIEPTDFRTAEITKALENAILHAAVMLPTELAMNMKSSNIAEATRLATTHPRLMPLYLGAGTGGRCIPLGAQYLLEKDGPHDLLRQALKIDRHIRMEVARAVTQRGCKTALVLGLAYRPDFRDMGNSPGLAIAQQLQRAFGVDVTVHDPMWSRMDLLELTGFRVLANTDPEQLAPFDAIVLVTPHGLYDEWPTTHFGRATNLRFVFDTQGAWADRFNTKGVEYKRVGDPGWLR